MKKTYQERANAAFAWMRDNRSMYLGHNDFDFRDWLDELQQKLGLTRQECADLLTGKLVDEAKMDHLENLLETESQRKPDWNKTGNFHAERTLEFTRLFGIENPDLCHRCQIKAKVRGDYCEECAQAIDARIAANEAEMRAEDAAAGAAWAQARKAGKSDDEQYAAYHEVKRTWGRGGARPGAGRPVGSTKVPEKPAGYQAGYQAGYKAGLRAKTIETSFDERVLPRWARQYPAVVERCKNNLAYRAQVCSATTAKMRTVLRREAGIR